MWALSRENRTLSLKLAEAEEQLMAAADLIERHKKRSVEAAIDLRRVAFYVAKSEELGREVSTIGLCKTGSEEFREMVKDCKKNFFKSI